MSGTPADSRVRWRCRRGLRELDLVFSRFLDLHYPHLTPDEHAVFEALLIEADLDIYDWLMQRRSPPVRFEALLARLQPPST